MRKSLLITLCLTLTSSLLTLSAQTLGNLWGLIPYGGDSTGGVTFKYNPTTSNDSVTRSFPTDGTDPQSGVIQASDGYFYGMTDYGGTFGVGAIFRADSLGNSTVIYSFDNGEYPGGTVIQGQDGNLYGLAWGGGANGNGYIFQCTTDGNLTDLYDFQGAPTDGALPNGNIIQLPDGTLCGLTSGGGTSDSGTIFKYVIGGAETVLHSFGGAATDGSQPNGGLVYANNNMLYGMTYAGGVNGYGSIFKCDTTGTYSLLYSFTGGTDGGKPYADLIQATNGYLYGTASGGGTSGNGVIFSCTLSGTPTVIYNFTGGNDGSYPQSTLTQFPSGELFGMANSGGASGMGCIFECDTMGLSLTTVHSFGGGSGDGAYPVYGSLCLGSNGWIYGTTSSGGQANQGVFFYGTRSSTGGVLHSFGPSVTGSSPQGSFVQGKDGNLYGLTSFGGTYGNGSIIKSDLNGNITVLYSFAGAPSDGAFPYGSLVQASDGNFYGMTQNGGTANNGTIFKYVPGGAESVTYSFAGAPSDGSNPTGSLIQVRNGSLFGMTVNGGSSDSGVVFKCTLGGTETILKNFVGGNNAGANPQGSLLYVSTSNNLYGLTSSGATSDNGIIFKIDTSTGAGYTRLHKFVNGTTDGQSPNGDLILANDGNLYGVTNYGGDSGLGVIFKYTLPGGIESLVYSFKGGKNDGAYPGGGLIQASDGNLYGMTANGDSLDDGTIFKSTLGGTESIIAQFNDTANGENPTFNNLVEAMSVSIDTSTNCMGFVLTASVKGGGAGTYTYTWNTTGTYDTINSIAAAGKYYVSVKNAKGITVSDTITMPAYVYLNASIDSVINPCPSSSNGGAQAVAMGGRSPYNYIWNSSPAQTNMNATGLPVGTYTVIVGDVNGCSASASITLTNAAGTSLNTQPSTTPQSVCPSSAATALSVGATGPGLTYQWYSNTTNSTSGGTLVTGATSSNYTPSTANFGTLYYYCIIGGECSPNDTSNTSGAITVNTVDTAVALNMDTLTAHATGGATYQWLDCGSGYSVIAGATNQKYTVTTTGNYAVAVTQSGCTDTSNCHYVNVVITGINNISPGADVSIYPLPNNGHFAISMNGTGYKAVTIYDEMGKVVFSQSLAYESKNGVLNVDMSNYSDGIYFAQFITSGGTINKKVIIQK